MQIPQMGAPKTWDPKGNIQILPQLQGYEKTDTTDEEDPSRKNKKGSKYIMEVQEEEQRLGEKYAIKSNTYIQQTPGLHESDDEEEILAEAEEDRLGVTKALM